MRKTVSAFLYLFVAMFLALAGAAAMLAPPAGQAQTIGKDKLQHAAGSAVLGAMATIQTPDPWRAWVIAMGPGVAKELYDARKGGTGFSVKDLIADGLGAYIGVKVGGLIFTRNQVRYTRTF